MTALVEAARPVWVVAAWSVREALRRRVFLIVGLLSLGFLALYALGCNAAFNQVGHNSPPPDASGVDAHEFVGATLNGLAMFAVLFLGSVLAAFLTLSTVRGDAENGLLQPLVVRPVGRAQVLLARWLAAAAVCTAYVVLVDAGALVVLRSTGSFTPDHVVGSAVRLALAVAVLAALCILGSTVLTSTANGIATFMALGGGLVAGLLGQVARALGNSGLEHAARAVAWGLPFEALYQDALALTTAGQHGVTGFLVKLGPLGGGDPAGGLLLAFVAGYLAAVAALAMAATARRDL